MMLKKIPFIFIFLSSILEFNLFTSISAKGFVEAKEEILTIPTYSLKSDDPNPPFWRSNVYPYPMQTNLSNKKINKKYKVIIMENDYIKLYICPDLGGKILGAFDKTDKNFDFIYYNEVVKPALIGLRGAWTSGGMEWNFPSHGHTVNTFAPVNYKIIKNLNGSISCIVGTEEWVSRMSWQVSITLYPDKSFIQTDIKLSNRTLHHNSAYFWVNAAVHAFEDTQIIFPNTRYVFSDGYRSKISWPINNGIDISLYKNSKNPHGYFCASLIDFNGIYNKKKNNGMVHYAPKEDAKGKKYWTWGTGFENFKWEQILTDFNGPYIEIQSGKLLTQSDTWILNPHFIEEWTEWWYPIKNMNGFVSANQNAAINFEQKNKSVLITLNVTSEFNNATIQLLQNSKKIFENIANLTPKTPYSRAININKSSKKFELRILDSKKNEIISYSTLKETLPVEKAPSKSHLYNQSAEDLDNYNFALSKIKLGEYKSAKDYLYKISKEFNSHDVIAYLLASIELKDNNLKQAELLLSKSINKKHLNIKSLIMLAMIKLNLGNKKEAYQLLNKATQKEPIDPLVIISQQLILQKSNLAILRDKPEYYLETALDFLEMNLINEAISTLKIYLNLNNKINNPFIYYYLGYLYDQLKNKNLASKYFNLAGKCSTDYIFPFRIEDENVLKTALKYNPSEWKNFYYLGTLLTSKSRWEEGLKFFIEAEKFNPKCDILYRNLGIIYWEKLKDYKEAKAMYQKAISISKKDPNLYVEFDKLLSKDTNNIKQRASLFQKAPIQIKNNLNFKVRKILFYLDTNQKQKALDTMKNLGFISYEVFPDSRLETLEKEIFQPKEIHYEKLFTY